MPTSRSIAAAFAATLAISACDLPTSADEAREHLGRNQEERIVPVQLPLPEISVTLSEQLGELSGIVDTTDLSFSVDPDTLAFGLDSLLALDPVDPDPVVIGYTLPTYDFEETVDLSVPPIPVSLGAVTAPLQIILVPGTPGGSQTLPLDLPFTSATFAAGSALEVTLTTDASASVTNASSTLETAAGDPIATDGPVSVGPGSTEVLTLPLGGQQVPGDARLVVAFDGGSGDGTGDELTVTTGFANAAVTDASGVDADLVSPVAVNETITLEPAPGSAFSEATLSAGTMSIPGYDLGSLVLTADFDPTTLAGLQVGGTSPDAVTVTGQVDAPAGATTVDITTTGSVTVAFTGIEVESVVLNSVSMVVDDTLAVPTDGTLDGLERVTIASGTLEVDVLNRLEVGGTVQLTLTGLTDGAGTTLTETVQLQPSPDGSPVTTSVVVDLADAVLYPAELAPTVSGAISGTDVRITPEAAAEAVTVDPYIEVQPREVVLDGVPDLSVALDERVSIATADIELGELADFLDRLDFNDVGFTVTVDNATGLDVRVTGFGMTLLDDVGVPVTDDQGDPVRVELDNDGVGGVTAPANAETVVTGDAAAFVNELLDRVAVGQDVEVAATGTAEPAADTGSIALGDSVSVVFEIRLGPDITIDPSGITLDEVVAEAITLDSIAAELMADLSEDLVSAGVEFEVLNAMPLGLSVTMALAPTPADTTGFDPFLDPEVLELPTFTVQPAEVDAEGRVTAPVTSSPDVTVANPSELGILGRETLGLGFRAEVMGPAGDRAQLQPSDSLVIRPLLKIEVRVGGNGGTQ